jgi:hypothetical protein
MELALLVFLRPFLYLAFYITVVYWIMRLIWKLMPDGKLKQILFKRRWVD